MNKILHLKFKDIGIKVDYDVDTCTFSFWYDGEFYSVTRPEFACKGDDRVTLNFCIKCYLDHIIKETELEKAFKEFTEERGLPWCLHWNIDHLARL